MCKIKISTFNLIQATPVLQTKEVNLTSQSREARLFPAIFPNTLPLKHRDSSFHTHSQHKRNSASLISIQNIQDIEAVWIEYNTVLG